MANNNYTIIDKLGSGGMGCVFRARDPQGRIVALKMMSNKVSCFPEYRQLFHDEASTLMVLNHPNVVHIVGQPYSDDSGNLYLPMEFVDGITLDHYVSRHGGRLDIHETVRIMDMVLEAMQYVHQRKRIHRDIKPSNIMIRPDGSVCIIDFGVAKDARVGTDGATVGRIVGTDGYMSPEQANGLHIDHRTDIYSIGCVLYFMLTGKHAVQRGKDNHETVLNINKGKMELPSQAPGVSPLLDYVFLKAVDKDMMRRYQSASQFRDAIDIVTGRVKPTVTVGKSPDNDIVVNNNLVSRHHLVIRGLTEPATGGSSLYLIEIEDKSTNGTGVAGRRLFHDTMVIEYNQALPQVLLAGHVNCTVNWNTVISILKAKGWKGEPDAKNNTFSDEVTQPHASGPSLSGEEPDTSPGIDDTPLTPHTDPGIAEQAPASAVPAPGVYPSQAPVASAPSTGHTSLQWWWGILIALFPVSGWIMSVLWSDTNPGKARQASTVAWWVLAVWLLIITALTLILSFT